MKYLDVDQNDSLFLIEDIVVVIKTCFFLYQLIVVAYLVSIYFVVLIKVYPVPNYVESSLNKSHHYTFSDMFFPALQ